MLGQRYKNNTQDEVGALVNENDMWSEMTKCDCRGFKSLLHVYLLFVMLVNHGTWHFNIGGNVRKLYIIIINKVFNSSRIANSQKLTEGRKSKRKVSS